MRCNYVSVMDISNFFTGRINRRNYAVVFIVLNIAYIMMYSYRTEGLPKEWATLIPTLLIMLVLVILSWSIAIRRFHDIGKSGWYMLLLFLPILNLILPIYLLFKSGDVSANKYGTPPKSRIDIADIFSLNR